MGDEAPGGPPPEFSRIVAVARLGGEPATYRFGANVAEREALARRLGLLSLGRFEVEARLARAVGGGVRLEGRIAADLVQECVVTLEPVPGSVGEAFAILYRRQAPRSESVDPDGEDVEPLESDEIDVGEAAAQQLSLAIDPFPRAPGAALPKPPAVSPELSRHPFAGLAKLTKR
jgi:uncharacterized metal-binding protein YceD (DUF177 family)